MIARFRPGASRQGSRCYRGGGRKEKSSTREIHSSPVRIRFPRRGAVLRIKSRGTRRRLDRRKVSLEISIVLSLSRISKNNCTRLRSRRITERKVECGSIKCARKEAEGSATRGHEERYTACAIFTLHSRAFSCSFFCCVYLFLFLFFPSFYALRFSLLPFFFVFVYTFLFSLALFPHCSRSSKVCI